MYIGIYIKYNTYIKTKEQIQNKITMVVNTIISKQIMKNCVFMPSKRNQHNTILVQKYDSFTKSVPFTR